jgi:hypothetical protein
MLLPSGPANTRCSVCRFDPGGLHVQLRPAPGTALQSPETGGQNRRYRDLSLQQRPHARYLNRGNARKLRAICQRPGNIGSHRTAWWWMRSRSNPSPPWQFVQSELPDMRRPSEARLRAGVARPPMSAVMCTNLPSAVQFVEEARYWGPHPARPEGESCSGPKWLRICREILAKCRESRSGS